MQNCIVDVTEIKNDVFIGDVVEISARRLNLSHDVTRIYHWAGKVFSENDNIFVEASANNVSAIDQRRETSIG